MDFKIGRFVVDDATSSPFYVYFQDNFPQTLTSDEILYLQKRAQEVINWQVNCNALCNMLFILVQLTLTKLKRHIKIFLK